MFQSFRKKRTYLDWASAAPVSATALAAFLSGISKYGNPSSPHAEGVAARVLVESSRKLIARAAGVKPARVFFTSGATEANALAIQGFVEALVATGRKLKDIHLLYLPTAHASVVETMQSLAAKGVSVEPLHLSKGTIDLQMLRTQIRPETVLVSMDLVCGETGTQYDTRDVRRVIDARVREREKVSAGQSHIALHVDASQAPFVESIDCNHLGADLLTLDAQKIGGVRSIGALVVPNSSTKLAPLFQGGGQEQGIRPGTENPALAAAFAAALIKAQQGRELFKSRSDMLRSRLLKKLSAVIPDMVINVGKEFTPHIVNVSFPGRDTDYAVQLLSKAGYAVSTKSACETDEIGSRVVRELMKGEEGVDKRALATLRISWGPNTSSKELDGFSKALISTLQFLDAHPV